MAEVIVLDLNVDTGTSLNEVDDIRDAFSQAEDRLFKLAAAGKEGTKQFRDAQLEAAHLKERVDDINESLDDLKPEAKLGAFTRVAGGKATS